MILAIDTATHWTGLALFDGQRIVSEQGWWGTNTQTVELTPAIGALLTKSNLEAGDLKAIAVAIGPGSYTSLRVGLAVAKGLALAHQLPLVGVPTLDIMAASVGLRTGSLLVAVEAGRKRVIAGLYRWDDRKGWQPSEKPIIDTWETLLFHLDNPTTFAGEISPEAAKLIRASKKPFHLVPAAASVRRAGYLAELGWQRWRRGEVDDAATLAPDYLRDPAGN
ncbi:MAG: tRNA (adenosine(37)-N6)-threonylcarbamoyltransferase complex dimerization subunit type 1 TsaB [Candidatus Promineifilaceae bacterium]